MKIIRVTLLSAALLLTACSHSPSHDTVSTVSNLNVPVMSAAPASDEQALQSRFLDNQARIGQLNRSLKAKYLQDVQPAEIFDTHSEAHRAYAALTKLEQLAAVNEQYRKDRNLAGLQAINTLLQPLQRKA